MARHRVGTGGVLGQLAIEGAAEDAALRVLIVDDEEPARALLTELLAGAEAVEVVGQCRNGFEAVQAIQALRPDLVLLDVQMPVLDGFATLQRIKDDPALEHVPVIMVTAVDDIDSVIRCIELGATDYLSKPVHGPLLAARLGASLAAKRLRDAVISSSTGPLNCTTSRSPRRA